MTNYQNWTKIPLTSHLTKFLYECYYQLSSQEGELLKTFDNGIFLIKGQEKYLDKHGNLRKNIRKYSQLLRINLSIIQVKGKLYYKIFINKNRIHLNIHPSKNKLITNRSMIQISDKEQIFKIDMQYPIDFKGNAIFSHDGLYYYLKTNFPENNYKIIDKSNTNPTPKLYQIIQLTKTHRIINEWNIIEKYLKPYINNLPNYESFHSTDNTHVENVDETGETGETYNIESNVESNVETNVESNIESNIENRLLDFEEIRAKNHLLTYPVSNIQYLYKWITNNDVLSLDNVLYYFNY
jgi:hypothetical protein